MVVADHFRSHGREFAAGSKQKGLFARKSLDDMSRDVGCEPLQHDSRRVGGWVVLGARGWLAPDDPLATERDAAVFRRELERLRLSVTHADREFGRSAPRLAMTHYPPWLEGREPTEVVDVLVEAGVRVCVYGHLHGEDHVLALEGEHRGIDFRFVAVDAVGFAPVEIDLDRYAVG